MAGEYMDAPEVAEIARDLIAKVASHNDLVDARIAYVFIRKAPTSRGHQIWGRARRITGLQAFLSNPEQPRTSFAEGAEYFVIEISHDIWQGLDDGGKRALVDHELSHCAMVWDEDDQTWVLAMRHHDVEEFIGVLQRNGLWRPVLQDMASHAAEQLALAFDRIADATPEPS